MCGKRLFSRAVVRLKPQSRWIGKVAGTAIRGLSRTVPEWCPRETTAADRIRRNTHTGRPPDGGTFLGKVGKTPGRRVRSLPVGRQKGRRKHCTEAAAKWRR